MEDLLGSYKLVLGLEIHLHLNVANKVFCRCCSDIYKKQPNTHTCPVCLGLPGALPVPNKEAVFKTQLLGLALNCDINPDSNFDRKHYFYPDLPKGYQISQYKSPLCLGGFLGLKSGKKAEIERIHLEEDTAKSIHEEGKTLLDFNMSGMPLVEIVTKPIFTSIEEAVEFGKKVQEIVREFGLSGADMEKGQLRLEPNISLRTPEMERKNELPKYKVEIKNINSFKFMENAVLAEIDRQRDLLEEGETPLQENRGYDEVKKQTVSQRSKEEAKDYRYFPEPDIPPMNFDKKYMSDLKEEFEKLQSMTPRAQKSKILNDLDMEEKVKSRLIEDLELNEISNLAALVKNGNDPDVLAKLFLNKKEFRQMATSDIQKLLDEQKNKLSDDSVIDAAVTSVVNNNQDAVQSYKSGKQNALQFLVGMVMRETKGKAPADIVKEKLLEKLSS